MGVDLSSPRIRGKYHETGLESGKESSIFYHGLAEIDVILHYLPKERYIVRNLLLH